jgi:hypothetical protein
MKTSKIALYAYLSCCIIAIIADVFKFDGIALFTIPLVIPALFFYYYTETKKISVLICIFLLANFIGDFLGLMDFENELYYVIPPFFVSNLIMVIIMIKNIEKFKFNIFNIFSLTIIGLFLTYILSLFLDLFSIEDVTIQIQVAVFGILLIILALLASYNIIWKMNIANLFLMMCASCVLISDVFYLVYNYQNQLQVLDCIHFSCQLFSYFFFIKYMLLRESSASIRS